MTTAAVVFPIGQDMYAVAANTVREVVCDPDPTRLPMAPPVLLGAFNLRGEVVPLFDTAALLGIGRLGEVAFAVVVDTASGPAGLGATGLPQVVEMDGAIGSSELRGTTGAYRVDSGIVVMVDTDELLGPHTNLGATVLMEASVRQ